MLKEKKIIICDMDGTLIDSLGVWDSVDTALIGALGGGEVLLASVGERREALLRKLRGTANPYLAYCGELAALCGSPLSAEETLALRERISREKLRREVRYKDGAAEAVKYLKARGFVLGIATTTGKKNMTIYRTENEHIQREAPIDEYFSFLYTRDDVTAIKPNPEVHGRILAATGARRSECLIIEDSLSGVLAAEAAGIEAAVLYDSYSEKDWPDIVRRAARHFSGWRAFLEAARTEETE